VRRIKWLGHLYRDYQKKVQLKTLNIVGKEVSQRKKKENANMVELSKSRFEG